MVEGDEATDDRNGMGERISLPSESPRATGIMPQIIAPVVIRMGRSRTGPAARSASRRFLPWRRSVLV